ncbi:MAG: hypothetical protein NZX77_22605, partial [Polyangiaceae bacterium]|nr:hypothetical protein [Polyangiaceae bacterium]
MTLLRLVLLELSFLAIACTPPLEEHQKPSPPIVPDRFPALAATCSSPPFEPPPDTSVMLPELRLLPPKRCDRHRGKTTS